jgi:uncharacterized protein YbjT (DUF2867 family)
MMLVLVGAKFMKKILMTLGLAVAILFNGAPAFAMGGKDTASADELILVLGASGRTGRYVIKYLKEQGRNFISVTSNKERAIENVGDGYNWVEADIKVPAQLEPLMAGVTKIISGVGANVFEGPNGPEFVDYGVHKSMVELAEAAGTIDHIVLMSSSGVTQEDNPLNKYGNVLTWKLKGEDAVRNSSIDHTIIRGGGLADNEADTVGIRMQQGDTVRSEGGYTGRGNFAALCIESIDNPDADNKTLEAFDDDSREIGAWRNEFGALVADK